jgi:sulfonate transport system permease protein
MSRVLSTVAIPHRSTPVRAESTRAGISPLRRNLLRGVLSLVLPLLVPVLLLGAWQWAAQRGYIAEQILPAPAVVFASFMELVRSGELWQHLQGSLARVGKAYAFAAIVGVALGTLLGSSKRAVAYIAPTFEVYAQTPVIAWIPIALMLFGISETFAVVLSAIATLVPVVTNTWKGVRNIPLQYLEVARTYRLGRWQTFRTVIVPAALPQILVGLRYGLTQAWLTLVAAELVGIDEGIGALIVQARNLFQLDVVLVGILTLGVVGLLLDRVFVLLERRLLRWRKAGF